MFQVGFSMNQKRETDRPVVVSTWQFGLKANEAAWQLLSAGGRALDAVEAGVRVTEADPNNGSVGIGGTPDEIRNRLIDSKSKL